MIIKVNFYNNVFWNQAKSWKSASFCHLAIFNSRRLSLRFCRFRVVSLYYIKLTLPFSEQVNGLSIMIRYNHWATANCCQM